VIHLLIVTGLLLAPAGTHSAEADSELVREVSRLVQDLDAAQLTQRDAAERALHDLGDRVLPLLPAISDRTSAEAARRLTRLRQQLTRAQARAAAEPTRVTLHGKDLPLAEVFAAISKQTGNTIVDHRAKFGGVADPVKVSVDFDHTPYWQALDQVLDQAGLTLYGFAGERGAFVINRPPGAAPRAAQATYAGMFRLEPVRFEAQRDLRNRERGSLRLFVEVSWEPRLQPFSLIEPLGDLRGVADDGSAIEPTNAQARVETLIREGLSTAELELPLELPPRGVRSIASLKGKLVALVPGPHEEFRFDELPLAAAGKRPRAVEQRKGGTTMTLESVRQNADLWEARLRMRFEAPETALESHRGWIYDNQALFEDAAGKQFAAGGMEQTLHADEEVGINYLFDLPQGAAGLKFVYRTPLVILEVPIEFEFLDLPLP